MDQVMRTVFWFCTGMVVYTYLGYVVLLWLEVRFRNRPVLEAKITPTVSVVIAAHNEQNNLPAKLENLRLMEYPQDRLQVIVASDGSTDRTADILRAHRSTVDSVILEIANGKASAINQAIKHATGEILVFMDARQQVALDAISNLVSCFADPDVGAVSGELLLIADESQSSDALGVYWKIEKAIRKLESASGSVVGVTGAIYAIRRDLYTAIPSGTILDDVFVPMHVARQGKRVVFQAAALAYDKLSPAKGKDVDRQLPIVTLSPVDAFFQQSAALSPNQPQVATASRAILPALDVRKLRRRTGFFLPHCVLGSGRHVSRGNSGSSVAFRQEI
jgi:biofilm PGA synthesis N-glycosyltransferase PgaC